MPSEPLPWDRKDFFKEKKHHNNHQDRPSDSLIGGGSGGGSVARWRDCSSHQARHFTRWGSDFRRPPGHGKQGGCNLSAEDSGYGYARSSDKMLEDESSRLLVSRDGKYSSRNSRENRGSFGQRDFKGHPWEMSNGSLNTPVRLHDVNSDRSVDDMLTYPSHPQSDFVATYDHIETKDHQHNKMGGVNGLGTSQRCERENSLDWKPLKWTRSTSLSSRGSGFSHSSSSKSLGGVDSSEGKAELQPNSSTLVQSPSGDAAICVTSAAPSEEMTSRKKPRLGWGEGLAKYEKKKDEGPDVSVSKDGAVVSPSNAEPVQSLSSTLAEKSPRVMGFLDCASPATPSSVACSSSPGVEEKAFGKTENVDNYGGNLCGSPSIGSQNRLEEFLFTLEKLDTSSIVNLGPSLIELLQSHDPALVDSSFVQSTAMNKLLIWKGDILKALEGTESEIDSLENELKSLKSALGSGCPCPTASSSLSEESSAKHFKEQESAFDLTARPAPLKIESCGDATVVHCSNGMVEGHANDEDIDSPGTATSKFVEPLSLVKAVSPSDMGKDDTYSGELDATQPTNIEVKCSVPDSYGEVTNDVLTYGNGGMHIEGKDGAPVSGNFNLPADGENMLCDIILGSNKESANRASEVFNKLLPSEQCSIDISVVTNGVCLESDSLIKEKIAKRKQFVRFKERVLILKFKAFQHLWKEDMRLLSARKCRARSQKRCELSLRSTHSGYQKHRSSIRSRFSSPVSGNLSLVPTTEVINFTSKLLSGSQVKVYRNPLKMPALILDKKEKMVSRFISSNGLVEDPYAVEKERSMINPWTSEEREIFLDKLATFGKDFRKIASFLDYRTTADCVEFYYKNHKSDCFQKMKKHDFNKQGKPSTNTYLVTSGKKWNHKMNAASLDILGEASEMAAAAQVDNGLQLFSDRISLRGQCDSKMSPGIRERSSSYDVFGSERETAAADVLAGICGSLSSEAMSSCITSSVDPGEGQREWKHQKLDFAVRRPSTSDVTQNVDDDTCSDESCGEMDPADWTDEEKSIFMEAFSTYGKDFSIISRCVRTRSRDQCKVFFSKARKCLGLDFIYSGCGNVRISVSDDANGGEGSDTEDVCALDTSSVICSDKLGPKMEDLPSSAMNINQDESDPLRPLNLQTDLTKSDDDDLVGPVADKTSEVECLVSDACRKETGCEIVSELESDKINGVDKQYDLVHPQKSEVILADTECARDQLTKQAVSIAASVSVGEAIDPCPTSSNAMVETKRVVGPGSTKEFGNDFNRQDLVLMDYNLNDKRDKKCNARTSGESEMMQVSNTVTNSFGLAVDTNSCSGFSFTPESQHISVKLDSVDKSPVIALSQGSSLAAASSIAQDSAVAIQLENTLIQDRLSSTLDTQESKVKSIHKSVCSNDYRQHLSESSQILKGYPLHIPTKKEVNGSVNRQLSEVQSNLKSDRNVGGPYLAQDCHLQKCNSSIPHSSIAELPFLPQSLEKASEQQPRTHSRCLSDSEKPGRRNDVKLFGKILSHPSSSPNPNASTHENYEEKGGHHHKQSSKSSNIKFTGHHPAHGGTTHLMKFDPNNFLGLQNVPVRSYGFWDGNRIQTGFSSLPDSALLLAKYPAAFRNYPTSSSKMEQQSLHSVNGTEHNLNGVAAVVPPREISGSNGVVDYQVYRSCDGTKVQPFTVDMKQRQELFSEMQRRNGFESRSSLQQQQQGRGLVGVNVVGRGGLLSGIQDPVAAIKRHYAKAEQFSGGQSGSMMMREEESWRGKGDIGR